MTWRIQNPPKVTNETPSSDFLRQTAMACGTNRAALPSRARPKTKATISFMGNASQEKHVRVKSEWSHWCGWAGEWGGKLKRSAPRALALAASSSRLRAGAVVSRRLSSRCEAAATASIASLNAASLAFEGLLNPLILRTYCSEALRISASETGGSKLKSILILRHICGLPL